MLKNKSIKKIKDGTITAYRYNFQKTSLATFRFVNRITFYNDDRTEKFDKVVETNYESGLYMTQYGIFEYEINGLLYQEGLILGVCEGEHYEINHYEIKELYESEKELLYGFVDKYKSQVILTQKVGNLLYTISMNSDINTLTKINKFILKMNENGYGIQILNLPMDWIKD